MLRYGVAFCAVCLGGLVGAADLAISLPMLPPHQRAANGRQSPEEERLIFQACVTLYGTAYVCGRMFYRWCGAHAHAAELHQWSQWHMAILNVAGGLWLIGLGVPALGQAVLRPSFLVGIILVSLTVWEGWQRFNARK